MFRQFHFGSPKARKLFKKVVCELVYKFSANIAKILIEKIFIKYFRVSFC